MRGLENFFNPANTKLCYFDTHTHTHTCAYAPYAHENISVMIVNG